MVIKVCGDNIAAHIIGRMLHRGKFLDIPADGKNDDTSGMLSRGSADACAALHDSVYLAVTLAASPLFKVILHVSERRLLRKRTDRACLESLPGAEYNLHIPVCLSLVITGKVKVNIRLLVPLESQEGFKGNVKSFFCQRLSAHRTVLIRHITACPAGVRPHFIGVKITVVAGGTVIMGT